MSTLFLYRYNPIRGVYSLKKLNQFQQSDRLSVGSLGVHIKHFDTSSLIPLSSKEPQVTTQCDTVTRDVDDSLSTSVVKIL